MTKALPLILGLILCSVVGVSAQTEGTTLYERNSNGYFFYRIPALCVAQDGSILAFVEARRDHGHDYGNVDIVVRRSTDGGATWGDMEMVWDDGLNTCGNPTPVVDRQTGRIWLFATWNYTSDTEAVIDLQKGKDSRRVFVLYSDDQGKSWSEAQDLTSTLKLPNWTWYATGPCHAIQKQLNPHKGRLVIPANHTTLTYKEGKPVIEASSHTIYSDDHGRSWQLGGTVEPAGGNESSVVELSDGTLMVNMRNYPEQDTLRSYALSRDGGQTWEPKQYAAELVESRCQGSILNYSVGKRPSSTLLFVNPRHSRKRENLTLSISRDNGQSWPIHLLIDKDPTAYSDLAVLGQGKIAVLYEKNDAINKICFRVLSVDSLVSKKNELK